MTEQDILRKVFFFNKLDDGEIVKFQTIVKETSYPKEHQVISEEHSGETLYIIKDGTMHITKDIDGRPRLLTRLGVGDFFGEISLFDQGLRTATAVTLQPCTLLEISKDRFDQLIQQYPAIGVKILYAMMQEMAKRLRKADDMMKNLVLWVMSTKEWERLP